MGTYSSYFPVFAAKNFETKNNVGMSDFVEKTAANFKIHTSKILFRNMKKSRKLTQDKSCWNHSLYKIS